MTKQRTGRKSARIHIACTPVYKDELYNAADSLNLTITELLIAASRDYIKKRLPSKTAAAGK